MTWNKPYRLCYECIDEKFSKAAKMISQDSFCSIPDEILEPSQTRSVKAKRFKSQVRDVHKKSAEFTRRRSMRRRPLYISGVLSCEADKAPSVPWYSVNGHKKNVLASEVSTAVVKDEDCNLGIEVPLCTTATDAAVSMFSPLSDTLIKDMEQTMKHELMLNDRTVNFEDEHQGSKVLGAAFGHGSRSIKPIIKSAFINDDGKYIHSDSFPKTTLMDKIGRSDIDAKQELLLLTSWDLPECVVQKYKETGIERMFDWQVQCLRTGSALEGGNLVYSAPTSAGKTLVAELLMLKRVLLTKKKALYILPFVSVAREKMNRLQDMFEEAGIRVGGFMASESPSGGLPSLDIAICTIEKANSLVNHLLEEKKISCLGSVVVDEMHMIGDPGRGYLLELLLTKILYTSSAGGIQSGEANERPSIQVIGMSATLPNLDMFCSWLHADFYCTSFRPVPHTELMKVARTVFNADGQEVFRVQESELVQGDDEQIIPLCVHTVRDGHCVLIFCPTKSWCEKLSETIARHFQTKASLPAMSEGRENKPDALNSLHDRHDVLEQLRRTPAGLDNILEKVVLQGVAFHHAGLTLDEREIIEGAYRRGVIKVLVATSTLSSGVNLPARRVIIRTPIFHGKLLDPLVYKQMAGRAGRKGIDSKGESILICKPAEKQKCLSLIRSQLTPVYSCLIGLGKTDSDFKSMRRALLEIVASGIATSYADIQRYAKCSYLHTCIGVLTGRNPDEAIQASVRYLVEHEFIRVKKEAGCEIRSCEEVYFVTQLGVATVASSLSPDEALAVFAELQKARRCFVLENELHLIYQVTPIYLQEQWPELDFYTYFDIWKRLPMDYKRVGELVGVSESFLARSIGGGFQIRTSEQARLAAIHRRFYGALVLQDLVNEVPLGKVSQRYGINRGLLQSLQNSSSTFAGMVTVFCQRLGWSTLEILFEQFQSRLSFGVCRDLCNLVRISLLNGFKARYFYNQGYHTVSALACASVEAVATLLRNSAPFESKRPAEGESAAEAYRRGQARRVWLTGKEGLTEHEAALLIIKEAKRIQAADAAALGLAVDGPIAAASKQHSSLVEEPAPACAPAVAHCASRLANVDHTESAANSSINTTGSFLEKRIDSAPVSEAHGSCAESIVESRMTAMSESKDLQLVPALVNLQLDEAVRTNGHLIGEGQSKSVVSDAVPSNPEIDRKRHIKLQNVNDRDCIGIQTMELSISCESDESLFSDNEVVDPLQMSNCSFPLVDYSCAGLEQVCVDVDKDPEVVMEWKCSPVITESTVANNSICNANPLLVNDDFQKHVVATQKSVEMAKNNISELANSFPLNSSFDNLLLVPQNLGHKFLEVASQRATLREKSLGSKLLNAVGAEIPVPDSFLDFTSPDVAAKTLALSPISDSSKFLIIDVTADRELFLTFLQEWKSQPVVSFCCACENVPSSSKDSSKSGATTCKYTKISDSVCVTGLAVCWGGKDVYYVNLEIISDACSSINLDDTSQAPSVASDLDFDFRLSAIKAMLSGKSNRAFYIAFDMKEQLKVLYKFCHVVLSSALQDPKVAHWMLDPEAKEESLVGLAKLFLSGDSCQLLEDAGGGFSSAGLGLVPQLQSSGRKRACVEAVVAFELMDVLNSRLGADKLHRSFVEIEMPSMTTFALLDLNGIGFCARECEKLKQILRSQLSSVEAECHRLAKRKFSLGAPNDVARVLYLELGLPSTGDPDAPVAVIANRQKPAHRGGIQLKHLSTSKAVLEKLKKLHPLPDLVLEWRRINAALKKIVYPYEREKVWCAQLHMYRIFSETNFRSATGRVSFKEPNIQNVPNSFDIKFRTAPYAEDPLRASAMTSNELEPVSVALSVTMRNCFVPFDGGVMLAADYSQLELRLIAHLAEDLKLAKQLNEEGDIFRQIASETNGVPVSMVTPKQRQQAKQVCYGIIYGMGPKALGEELKVSEIDAASFIERFKNTYPAVRSYVRSTIESARRNGFVTTLAGRRRYFPSFQGTDASEKAHAERQAVNTTIQGSAADLMKKATNAIMKKLHEKYGSICLPLPSLPSLDREAAAKKASPCGAFLVLQLHDELLFEVRQSDIENVKEIVKCEMENAIPLLVRTPVKLRCGPKWGDLNEC